jgi:hypothetical protein
MVALFFYFILFLCYINFYNTHQVLVGIPQRDGGLVLLFYLFLFYYFILFYVMLFYF